MESNIKVILFVSLAANILLLTLICLSLMLGNVRYEIYETTASRTMGNPDIVFTGDSITRGGGIWAFRINRYNLKTSNIAKSGFTTNQVNYMTIKAIEKNPKAIFIMSGRNEMLTNYDNGNATFTISSYKPILDAALNKNVKIYVTSTLYRADEQHPEIIDELNVFLKEYCVKNGETYIDLNSKLSLNGKLRQEFAKDNIHINEKAYDIWASMIKSVLK